MHHVIVESVDSDEDEEDVQFFPDDKANVPLDPATDEDIQKPQANPVKIVYVDEDDIKLKPPPKFHDEAMDNRWRAAEEPPEAVLKAAKKKPEE